MFVKTKTTEERFWEKVQIKSPEECWPWVAYTEPDGRGRFNLDGRAQVSSRIAAKLSGMDVPDGMEVCHHCDNPNCCNPGHFFVGTHADNVRDMVRKKRNVLPKAPPWNSIKYPREAVDKVFEMAKSGVRQIVISRAVGMSPSHISKLLSGKHRRVY